MYLSLLQRILFSISVRVFSQRTHSGHALYSVLFIFISSWVARWQAKTVSHVNDGCLGNTNIEAVFVGLFLKESHPGYLFYCYTHLLMYSSGCAWLTLDCTGHTYDSHQVHFRLLRVKHDQTKMCNIYSMIHCSKSPH